MQSDYRTNDDAPIGPMNPLTTSVPESLLSKELEAQLKSLAQNVGSFAAMYPDELAFYRSVKAGHQHMAAAVKGLVTVILEYFVESEVVEVDADNKSLLDLPELDQYNRLYVHKTAFRSMVLVSEAPVAVIKQALAWLDQYPLDHVYCAVRLKNDGYLYAAHPPAVEYEEPEHNGGLCS